ncbi:helix-turn-helix transcriptional regulator [Clostridium botulinum]|nr:helix-turn-helix transcriptional regulator [Clostridium botulinum]NFP30046.1 helix-turn-helix transcriptional regulator [Clostridium botulinum]
MRMLMRIRKAKNWSYKKLSKKSGVPESTISDYEKGKIKKLNSIALNKLANALQTTTKEIQKDYYEISVKKCLNEKCLLNKNKYCQSPQVCNGKAWCRGENKISSKEESRNC